MAHVLTRTLNPKDLAGLKAAVATPTLRENETIISIDTCISSSH